MEYTLTLQNKYTAARDTPVFVFDKPDNLSFKAGQFCILRLNNMPITDSRGSARPLSIASAPSQDKLELSWRMSQSAFKQSADKLSVGDTVTVQGPFGEFFLPENKSIPVIFLVGGIGITPVRSMLLEDEARGIKRPITVIYSNRTPQDAPFFDEINNFGQQQNISIINTITNVKYAPWSGERGYITSEMIQKNAQWAESHYYIVGAGGFVSAISDVLAQIIPSNQVHVDNFGS
jgi:ferredoxin-NADP reductase